MLEVIKFIGMVDAILLGVLLFIVFAFAIYLLISAIFSRDK